MQPVSRLRQREVEMYFDVVAEGGSSRRLSARAHHNLAEMEHDDYASLSARLRDADATASFLFLGRDADRYGETMAMLDDAGHEVVLHGHRHVACGDIDGDLVHENLACGLDAIEDAAGVTPRGFVAPGRTVNAATLEACVELGLEWVLGQTDAEVPPAIDFLEAVTPYDLVWLNEGLDPDETFDRVADLAADGRALFFHPNLMSYFGATAAFDVWIADASPASVTNMRETGGVGMLNDAARPLRIE
jgi:peptidoglycan/xylan/chitin deacetylase (PgdA/CDA1 family)